MGIISNAMAIGHFTMKDMSRGSHPILKDKHLIYFFNTNELNLPRFLFIAPTLGAMEYNSRRHNNAHVEDVPTADGAEKMAEDVLFQLGVDRSLVCNPKTGYDETSIKFKYNRQTHQLVQPGTTNVTLRGVAFRRRIDGILESSAWCFLIHFRSHGEIEDFSFMWRNLLPQESHCVLTLDEIVKIIKSGKAVLPPQFCDTSDVDKATRLTINKITPYYYNGTGKESLDLMYPYAEMEVSADLSPTNSRLFYLQCPILSTNATVTPNNR